MAKPKAVKANYGEKTIKVTLSFWTNGHADKGYVVPKHAWDSGMVHVAVNKTHGIASISGVKFRSLSEIGDSVRTALEKSGVHLQRSKPAEAAKNN